MKQYFYNFDLTKKNLNLRIPLSLHVYYIFGVYLLSVISAKKSGFSSIFPSLIHVYIIITAIIKLLGCDILATYRARSVILQIGQNSVTYRWLVTSTNR